MMYMYVYYEFKYYFLRSMRSEDTEVCWMCEVIYTFHFVNNNNNNIK